MTAPLILTLGFHPDDQNRFDVLRQRHFPPERNHIPAHLTLFHHLPGSELGAVDHSIGLTARQPGFPVEVTGLRSLGRGVAYTFAAPPLLSLRSALARHWHDHLTAQDRQGWRPHLTIQNKAAPGEAAALLANMQVAFTPFTVRAEALLLWHYLGGPWRLAARHDFIQPGPALPP